MQCLFKKTTYTQVKIIIDSQGIINEQFIETESWKNNVIYALGDEVVLISMNIKDDNLIIYGDISKNNKCSNKTIKSKVKDGFHKATHAGDTYNINGHDLLIEYKKVKVLFLK